MPTPRGATLGHTPYLILGRPFLDWGWEKRNDASHHSSISSRCARVAAPAVLPQRCAIQFQRTHLLLDEPPRPSVHIVCLRRVCSEPASHWPTARAGSRGRREKPKRITSSPVYLRTVWAPRARHSPRDPTCPEATGPAPGAGADPLPSPVSRPPTCSAHARARGRVSCPRHGVSAGHLTHTRARGRVKQPRAHAGRVPCAALGWLWGAQLIRAAELWRDETYAGPRQANGVCRALDPRLRAARVRACVCIYVCAAARSSTDPPGRVRKRPRRFLSHRRLVNACIDPFAPPRDDKRAVPASLLVLSPVRAARAQRFGCPARGPEIATRAAAPDVQGSRLHVRVRGSQSSGGGGSRCACA